MQKASASILLALALLGLTPPAHAALAPEYYEQARAEAADVVVIDVADVGGPPFLRGYGFCSVEGVVSAVERGARYTVGEEITLSVPCMRPHAEPPAGPTIWQDYKTLRDAPAGRAFLNDGRLARSQYDALGEDAR